MIKLSHLLLPCMAIVPLTFMSDASAADSCSLSEILQPAIDGAAQDSECNADGVYLSGEVIADTITTKCNKTKTVERCRKCVKEERDRDSEIIKALIKQGLFSRNDALAIKPALDALKNSTCGTLPPTDPSTTPTATPTPGTGDGNREEHPAPSPAPTPPPTGSPKPVEIGPLLQAACPCQGQFTSHESYLQCASNFLGGKVTSGVITKDRAYEVYFYIQKNTCGAPVSGGDAHPPAPTPTPSGTSHPL